MRNILIKRFNDTHFTLYVEGNGIAYSSLISEDEVEELQRYLLKIVNDIKIRRIKKHESRNR